MRQAKTDAGYVIAGHYGEWLQGVPTHPKNDTTFQDVVQELDGRPSYCESWLGFRTRDGLMALASDGWPEGVRTLREMEETIGAQVASKMLNMRKRRRLRRGAAGNEYDVHAGLQGRHDKAWSASRVVPQHGKSVDVCLTLGAPYTADQSRLFYPAACALVAARILISSGYHVRLFACSQNQGMYVSRSAPDYLTEFVMLSDYGQALDMRAASLMSHGGIFRYYILVHGLMGTPYKARTHLGYAQPANVRSVETALRMMDRTPSEYVLFSPLPGQAQHFTAEDAADYVVRKMLANLS